MTTVPADQPNDSSAMTDDLVDRNLTEESLRIQNLLRIATIEPPQRRLIAGFLAQSGYQNVRHFYPPLLGMLFLECLPAYVHSRGGEVVWTALIDGERAGRPIVQHTATVAGKVHRMPREGSLFLRLPGERVVVTASWHDMIGGRGQTNIGVCSNQSASSFFEKWRNYARENNFLRGRAFFANGETIERQRKYCWDDIYITDEARRLICTHVEGFLANYDRLRGFGVKARRGLILAGPPGTGKTLLGKVLADTLDTSFIWVSPRHVVDASSFKGILDIARFVTPTVLFLEDIDLFAEERGSRGWSGLGELMNQLDGAVDNKGVVTLATTNRLDVIERALRNRPGRFDRIIKMETMDAVCRRQMLSHELRNACVSPDDLDYLVEATEDYTGAQVEELAHTIYILALAHQGSLHVVEASSHPDSGSTETPVVAEVSIDRQLIDSALDEVHVERRARVGFHVA